MNGNYEFPEERCPRCKEMIPPTALSKNSCTTCQHVFSSNEILNVQRILWFRTHAPHRMIPSEIFQPPTITPEQPINETPVPDVVSRPSQFNGIARQVLLLVERDGRMCHLCDRYIEDLKEASADHKIPRVLGGKYGIQNRLLAYRRCDGLHGIMDIDEARTFIRQHLNDGISKEQLAQERRRAHAEKIAKFRAT
jgi:hypothetical protein